MEERGPGDVGIEPLPGKRAALGGRPLIPGADQDVISKVGERATRGSWPCSRPRPYVNVNR
jgi:hypothetical protein